MENITLKDISIKFTESVLDDIIRNAGGTKHLSWKFSGGTKKGDSYISETFRLIIEGQKANGETFEVHTYVKTLPKNLGRRKTFRSPIFSQNECNFYEIILAKYKEFQEKKGIYDGFTNVPICLKSYFDGEHDFIVLKDLSLDGYQAPLRQNEFSFEICKLLMETLGKFHGISLAIQDQEPDEFKKLINATTETYYGEQYRNWYASVLKKQIEVARDAIIREYPNTKYEEKTKHFIDNNLYDTMIGLVNRRNQYSVISHGDCWVLNFLIRNNANDQPTEAIVIDFQLARYASPALDISFFIYSCTTQSLRSAHYADLIKAYHKSACDLITKLGSNPEQVYPYSALLNELKECGKFGIGMGMESIPLSVMDDSDLADLDSIPGDEAVPMDWIWKYKPIENKESRQRLAEVFVHAIDQGYLD